MNNFEINPNKEYLLAGDISASMQTVDPLCDGMRRYDYMLEKFKAFINIAKDFDEHGAPTVFLFGKEVHKYEHTNIEIVEKKLSNVEFEGLTNTDLLLEEAFAEHREEKSERAREGKVHPGTCLMIFTDGVPTNYSAVERTILHIANGIDRQEEFDVVFLTVGTLDQMTNEFLNRLQSGVNGKAKYNIVSVKELDKTNFLSAATE